MPPEVYQLPAGVDVAANLPPVQLPGSSDQPQRLTIDIVKPKPKAAADDPWGAAGFTKQAPAGAAPAAPAAPAPPAAGQADPWAAAGFSTTAPPPPETTVPTGEAVGRGAIESATFGLAPAIAGVSAAGAAGEQLPMVGDFPGLEIPAMGAARLSRGEPQATQAYEQERQASLAQQTAAQEQHPYAFMGGELAGGLLTPGFGAAAPGTLGARLATGAIAGGVGGGLSGAGRAISEGASPDAIARAALQGVVLGAPTGAAFKGVVGPRPVPTAVSPGQRAAAAAEALGAPLPRGTASDYRLIQGLTAQAQSIPIVGQTIRSKIERVGEKAGEFIEDTARELSQGEPERAVADTLVRPALETVIDSNIKDIDASYNAVRGMIDQNARMAMPRTSAALSAIVRARTEAGWENPGQGLEQFFNVAQGTTFNGAQRARVDARSAGDVLRPHPGFDKGDFNKLTRAMTADLRQNVQRAAAVNLRSPQQALRAFDEAERQFGALADQNKLLHRLVNAPGQGAIAKLVSSAREKGGDVRLLAQLRNSMPPDDFNTVSGLLLHELGTTAGDFSLTRFVTGWNKVSEGAKRAMFSPEHRRDIDEIVNLGTHIKGALKQANVSHTAGALLLYGIASQAPMLAINVATGEFDTKKFSAGELAGQAGVGAIALWLGSRAKTASMAAFMRAHRGAQLNPTPARIAAFKLATRNLANNLGLDPAKVARQVENTIATTPSGDAGQQ